MGFLRSFFGPSKDEIWSQLACDIGGCYEKGSFLGRDALRCRAGEWEITLDTYTQSDGESGSTCTRMRAPFINKDGLYFKIHHESFFTPLGKLLGMQDIEVGDPIFDSSFVIKGNNEEKVRQLLNDAELKRLILAQPRILFQVKDDEGWFGARFPAGVDELYFECYGVMKDEARLKDLFTLFTLTLERLVRIDSAYEDDPLVKL